MSCRLYDRAAQVDGRGGAAAPGDGAGGDVCGGASMAVTGVIGHNDVRMATR